MKTIFENDTYAVKETGHDYDYVALIENKTDHDITLVMDIDEAEENCIDNFIRVPANDWVGMLNMEYGYNDQLAFEQGAFKAYTDEELTEAGIEDPYND